MISSVLSVLIAAAAVAAADSPFPAFSGDPFQKYTLSANGISASFIPYGARLTSLCVHDRNGNWQDVAIGYDEGSQYLQDTLTNHTNFGSLVGRYANRIKNGTFELDGQTYHIPTNEHKGANTLHGGLIGYDQQNWTVVAQSSSSITFMHYDAADQGFPGDLLNYATYTLEDDASWTSRIVSIPLNDATPVMLSNHVYWNLGAFVDEEGETILNHTLYMPYAKRRIGTDGILVPNGELQLVAGTGLDFTKQGTTIGQNINNTLDACGSGCVGIDNAFITDRSPYAAQQDPYLEVLKLSSASTGIELTIKTNQGGIQLYSCGGQNGSIPLKQSQQHVQGQTSYLQKYGCLVIETQDWIDAVNQPQWGREDFQIFSRTTEPAVSWSKFSFGLVE
ncbi:unnamed protein product [Zymoseptoria tritici ST99CH_1E4]|uniref:Aldose 1-epimerase n=1 Tax=Zymoseptoria tritici ST99CH_1E4 TaxID=1276532 RepID=A0A2H1FJ73_ZYMTR|nr:unnamed protein product [Zymoseptoria tritici ST99CH_1E4]